MRKLFNSGICLVVFSFICVSVYALERKFDPVEHIFSSSAMPKVKFKIAPEFEYIGHMSNNESAKINGKVSNTTGYKIEKFVFGVKNDSGTLIRGMVLETTTIGKSNVTWAPFDYKKISIKHDYGKVKIGRDRYKYVNYSYVFEYQFKEEMPFIKKKGYKIPGCIYYKELHRDIRNVRFTISYFEAIDGVAGACNSWMDKSMLSSKQKEFITEFNKRFEDVIQAVK